LLHLPKQYGVSGSCSAACADTRDCIAAVDAVAGKSLAPTFRRQKISTSDHKPLVLIRERETRFELATACLEGRALPLSYSRKVVTLVQAQNSLPKCTRFPEVSYSTRPPSAKFPHAFSALLDVAGHLNSNTYVLRGKGPVQPRPELPWRGTSMSPGPNKWDVGIRTTEMEAALANVPRVSGPARSLSKVERPRRGRDGRRCPTQRSPRSPNSSLWQPVRKGSYRRRVRDHQQ
jgi:hypothetical protein